MGGLTIAEADNAIEFRFETVFVFERFGPSLVPLRQPHCGLARSRYTERSVALCVRITTQ